MTIKVPNNGEEAMLKDALGLTTPANLTLKLYTNNYTPVDASTASSFTEMTGQSYAAKTLSMGSWTESSVAGVATAVYPVQTWTFSAGGPTTIYGYYVVGADGIIRWAEKFAAPFIAEFSGDAIVLTPQLTLQTGA
jgi:hypothetical protein